MPDKGSVNWKNDDLFVGLLITKLIPSALKGFVKSIAFSRLDVMLSAPMASEAF